MPADSMMSVLCCLMPAVSIKRNRMPSILMTSSTVSLVVPGISLTIALSSFNRAFNNVDFPEFGFPMIATLIPFLITLPSLNESISEMVTLSTSSISSCNCLRSANSTSSWEKSNSSSMRAENRISLSLSSFNCCEKPPRIL